MDNEEEKAQGIEVATKAIELADQVSALKKLPIWKYLTEEKEEVLKANLEQLKRAAEMRTVHMLQGVITGIEWFEKKMEAILQEKEEALNYLKEIENGN